MVILNDKDATERWILLQIEIGSWITLKAGEEGPWIRDACIYDMSCLLEPGKHKYYVSSFVLVLFKVGKSLSFGESKYALLASAKSCNLI